jgi:hypothetical protein
MADYTKMDSGEMVNACGSDATKWAEAFAQHAKSIADRGGDILDRGWLIGWFANAIVRAQDEMHWAAQKKLNPAEAVYGFAAYLTTREEPIVMGAAHEAGPAADAVKRFIDTNGLGDVSGNWPNNLKHPKEAA